jgi:hypothetical protein
MSRKRKKEDANKPISARAKDLAEWLEDLQESASLVRLFRLWWNRFLVLEIALEACDALVDMDKRDDKLRRAVQILVNNLGLDGKHKKEAET